MDHVLQMRGVNVSFAGPGERIDVLCEFDLSVARAECVALIGPSGSGKSTALHVAAGLRRPESGTVALGAERLEGACDGRAASLRARTLGMVFQSFHLLPHLSALGNARFPALLVGLSRRDADRAALGALERVGVESRANHKPAALSGGEQQRVAIARAIVNQPLLVLADEPTGNLDGASTTLVTRVLTDLARDGTAVLVATHDPEVAAAADRVVDVAALRGSA